MSVLSNFDEVKVTAMRKQNEYTCRQRVKDIGSDVTHLVAAVLSELDASHHLLINEVGGHVVLLGVMPRREDLLPEKDPRQNIFKSGIRVTSIGRSFAIC